MTIYKSFDVLKARGHDVLEYVVMPNHLHLLLYYSGIGKSLNVEIGEAKRFVAYEVIKRLTEQGELGVLSELSQAVQMKDKARGKLHEVWEDSFDSKECRTKNSFYRSCSIYLPILALVNGN